MTIQDTIAMYGAGKQALSLYGLFGAEDDILPTLLDFTNHFGWACRHTAIAAADVPVRLVEAGYDYAAMASQNLVKATTSLVALSVPQLYSAQELLESSRLLPGVLINYEYLVRDKTTGEMVDNQLTWLKAGEVVRHQAFLTADARAQGEEVEQAIGGSAGPSLCRHFIAV